MPEKDSQNKRLLSRRSLLRNGVLAGAAGIGVAMVGGTGASALSTGSYPFASHTAGADNTGASAIVLYLPDPRSGEVDIFAGTSKTHRSDRALARLVASLAPRT